MKIWLTHTHSIDEIVCGRTEDDHVCNWCHLNEGRLWNERLFGWIWLDSLTNFYFSSLHNSLLNHLNIHWYLIIFLLQLSLSVSRDQICIHHTFFEAYPFSFEFSTGCCKLCEWGGDERKGTGWNLQLHGNIFLKLTWRWLFTLSFTWSTKLFWWTYMLQF